MNDIKAMFEKAEEHKDMFFQERLAEAKKHNTTLTVLTPDYKNHKVYHPNGTMEITPLD